MIRRGAALALVALAASGCPRQGTTPNGRAPASSSTAVRIVPPPATAPPPEPAERAVANPDEVIGTLGTSKGMVSLGDVLLTPAQLRAQLGDDWRRHLGRRVRARGTRETYQCGPQEQCLLGGSIPKLRDVVSIELCRGGPMSSAEDVECPLSESEVKRCLDSCQRESDRCDDDAKGDRGALRRCGCAWISCKEGCRKDGIAFFACR